MMYVRGVGDVVGSVFSLMDDAGLGTGWGRGRGALFLSAEELAILRSRSRARDSTPSPKRRLTRARAPFALAETLRRARTDTLPLRAQEFFAYVGEP